MPRARRNREVNIFNFSFLDILACTVGALTFILVMVVVINIESLPADLVFRLEKMGEDMEIAKAEAEAAQSALQRNVLLTDQVRMLESRIDELSRQVEDAQRRALELEQEKMVAEDMLDAMAAGQDQDAAMQDENQQLVQELATAQLELEQLRQQLEDVQSEMAETVDGPTDVQENWWHRLGIWKWLVVVVVGLMILFGALALWSIIYQLYLYFVKGEVIESHRRRKNA